MNGAQDVSTSSRTLLAAAGASIAAADLLAAKPGVAAPGTDDASAVALAYRREGSDWRLAHRHAGPLVAGVSPDHAAVLTRGAPAAPAAP